MDKQDLDIFVKELVPVEKEEPSFIETGLAAARTSLTGASTFLNMVDRKHMMPTNEGDDNYADTEEFRTIVDEVSPNLPVEDLLELTDAKNADYLRAKALNQKRHREALKTLEESGATGVALEMVLSMADAPSWVAGGLVFKGGKTLKTALDIQRTGAKTLYDVGLMGTAAGTAVYTSEASIQAEAGVDMEDRLNTTAKYGAMFGMALPLLGQTVISTATKGGRQSLAANTTALLENIPGTGGLRGFFSHSAADQAIHNSFSPTLKELGEKATTRVTAARDADGNFVADVNDKAMDYVQTDIESSISALNYGVKANSDKNKTSIEQQALLDGQEYNIFTDSVEQTVRRDVAKMSDDELVTIYKEATGIEATDFDKALAKTNRIKEKVTKDNQILLNRIETNITNSIKEDITIATKKADISRKSQLKTQEEYLERERAKVLKANEEDTKFINRKHIFKMSEELAQKKKDKLAKDIEARNEKLKQLEAKVEELRQDTVLDDDTIAAISKRRRAKFENQIKRIQKAHDARIKELDDELQKINKTPVDVYDVVTAHVRSKRFDDGVFVVPPHLKYIEDFYMKYGKDATEVQLKGIAGKDSRGYNHIKHNQEVILRDQNKAIADYKEMMMSDELNKMLLQKGEITEADIEEAAKAMVEKAIDRDFTNTYLDGGKAKDAVSASKQRKLRLNRALHPEYFVSDVEVIGTEYADKIGGKIALKKFFGLDTDNLGRLSTSMKEVYDKVAREAVEAGASQRQVKKDVENARAILETVAGVRKYVKNPDEPVQKVARLLKKGASALYNAGFVKYAIVEWTVAVMRNGLKPTLDAFVPAMKQISEHVKSADANDPMVKLLRQTGLAIQTQRGIRYSRYDNFEVTPTTGKSEMFLDTVAHWGRKYSGFNFVNDVSDAVSGGAALNELQTLMKRPTDLTTQEASRLARYGLTSDDLAKLNKQNIEYSADGQVKNWNQEEWTDKELAHRFTRYLGRAVRDTIMRADGTRVHRWQSDVNNPLAQLGLQFTQMPVALFERLLLNIGDEGSTRTVVGMMAGVGIMYSILKLEDLALVASGAKDAADSDDDLLVRAVTRTPIAGIVPNYIDVARSLTGHSPLGSAFAPRTDLAGQFLGAGYSAGNKALKAAQGVGDGVDGVDASNFLKITPIINSFPILNVGIKSLEHQLKTEGKWSGTEDVSYDIPLHDIVIKD